MYKKENILQPGYDTLTLQSSHHNRDRILKPWQQQSEDHTHTCMVYVFPLPVAP